MQSLGGAMNTTNPRVWDDILAQVRLNHPHLVRGWFHDLAMIRVDKGTVYIKALNDAQKLYLQQHCLTAFAEASQAATGRLVSVAFECDAPTEPVADHGGTRASWAADEPVTLNPDYTFDHFVTGPCNRLAHAAAQGVAADPGHAYNPFFIHGAVGLGKTHLLQAICHEVRNQNYDTPCLYISCETFINHFIEAIELGALHEFRFRYRHAAMLVIDDIQFLAERERSQEEFFHTFNTLYQSQRQIILSADCPPSEIPSLEERLVSRFNSGLVALLERPCLETRMAIVQTKAKLRCIPLPDDVVHYVAGRFDTNIRDLEGALTKIDALSQTLAQPINLDLARQALGIEATRSVPIPVILETVARRFAVKVSDLQGKRRSREVTLPRHLCMYLARQLTSLSFEQIGGYFGGRDHSTVLHASRSVEEQAERDARLRELLDELTGAVKNATCAV